MTIEAGYKGIINDRVLLAIDAYYTEKKNFVGSLQMKTPFVLVPTLSRDLTRDLAAGIAGNSDLVAILNLLGALSGLDMSPEAAAAILVGIAGSGLPSASTPIGVVQPNENHAGVGNLPELLVTYPNFGHISYYGADVSVQVLASDQLSLFANMSWVSDDFFDNTETGEDLATATLALNAPALKYKLGGSYRLDNGLSVIASGRYVDGFRMVSGQYIGDVDPYFLVDLGVGYDVGRGLRADLNVANVTDNVHREFIGAPKIGRVATLAPALYHRVVSASSNCVTVYASGFRSTPPCVDAGHRPGADAAIGSQVLGSPTRKSRQGGRVRKRHGPHRNRSPAVLGEVLPRGDDFYHL